MSIATIGGIDTIQPAVASTAQGAAAATSTATTAPAATTISAPGELLSRLTQLSQSNPAKFSAIARSGSTALAQAATTMDGSAAHAISALSQGFAQAAAAGSVAPIDPSLFSLSKSAATKAHGRHPVARIASIDASRASLGTSAAEAALQATSNEVDAALGLAIAPLGPWFPR